MKRYLSSRRFLTAALFSIPLLAMIGCETLQPAIDMATAVGVSTGAISQGQADSISRSSRAVGKSFEDITPEQEYYIGRAVAATVLGSYQVYNNDATTRYVNTIGQTLAQASDRPYTRHPRHAEMLQKRRRPGRCPRA
jgi:predicted Zn-dependent protease